MQVTDEITGATAPAAPVPAAAPEVVSLDPFIFFPSRRSVLGTFGGEDRQSDTSYAFHTNYVETPPGEVEFTLTLADLVATEGTLTVRVHVIPADHSAEARIVKTAQLRFDRLVDAGGTVAFRVLARRGMLYAILGQVLDRSDAATSGVSITLGAVANGAVAAEDLVETRHSVFGGGATADVPHLLSPRPPIFPWPVSQPCTDAQLKDREFRAAVARLDERAVPGREVWKQAYVLKVLERYGMLQPGASGLALGSQPGALPAIAAAADCSVAVVMPPEHPADEALAALRRPATCAEGAFVQHVSVLSATVAALPSDVRGLDFLWSTGAIEAQGTIGEAIDMVLRTTLRLATGGIAIHTLDLRIDANDEPGLDAATPRIVFRRRHVERLALLLLAAGHDVSQFRYAGGRFGAFGRKPDSLETSRHAIETVGDMRIVPFGLVARRGDI